MQPPGRRQYRKLVHVPNPFSPAFSTLLWNKEYLHHMGDVHDGSCAQSIEKAGALLSQTRDIRKEKAT